MKQLLSYTFFVLATCAMPTDSFAYQPMSKTRPDTRHIESQIENGSQPELDQVWERSFNNEVLQYINEMRKDPKAFYHKYVPEYIKNHPDRFTDQYTRSLKKTMLSSGPLPLFETASALEQCARLQYRYLSQFGGRRLTHEQGAISFAARMKKAGLHCLAENLYDADKAKALNVVLDLLIDQHVPSFGHRLNLMNPIYTSIGIVSGTPAGGRTIVVMDFGCKN